MTSFANHYQMMYVETKIMTLVVIEEKAFMEIKLLSNLKHLQLYNYVELLLGDFSWMLSILVSLEQASR